MLVLALAGCAHWAQEPRFGSLRDDRRPFSFAHNIELFQVSNGLTVATVSDGRTNLVTIDVRYKVGASADPKGRAGMAHLVEHLLFELRDHPDGPTLGDELNHIALYSNASTTWDATHYDAIVPMAALPEALALEARRMRGACDQLDEPTFARERDVVLAEGAERDAPLAATYREIMTATFGAKHPYARSLSSNELAHATRDEVCQFITDHYGPDRAILVVTGRIPSDLGQQIGAMFGPIQSTALKAQLGEPPANLAGSTSHHTGPVKHPSVMVVLPYPAWGNDKVPAYRLAAALLDGALGEELPKHDWLLGADVSVIGDHWARALAVTLEVTEAAHLDEASALVFARSATLFDDVTADGLMRSGRRQQLDDARGWDDLLDRGAWVADFLHYTDDHWFMLKEMRIAGNLNVAAVKQEFATTWTRAHSHIAMVTPSGKDDDGRVAHAVPTGTHATTPFRWPVDAAEADQPLAVTAPTLADRVTRYDLPNGLTVELAPDARSPIVEARMVYPVGRAHEPHDRPGLATAAAVLLSTDRDGFYERSIADRLNRAIARGTDTDWDVDETSTTFTVSGLAYQGDWHVWRLSWWLDLGWYNQDDLDRLHRIAKVNLRTAADDEVDHDAEVFLARLFGADHPYAVPAPDTNRGFLKLSAGDLRAWRAAHYRPEGATLIITGGFELEAMRKEVDELFGAWSGPPPAPLPEVPPITPAHGPSWLAADRPAETQAVLRIAFPAASDPAAASAERLVLVGMLDDELRDVREGLGASYGLHVSYLYGAAGGVLLISGRVDEHLAPAAAKTVMAAIARLRDHAADERDAFVRARSKAAADAQAQTGGADAVARHLASYAQRGQSIRRDRMVVTAIGALTPAALAKVAAGDLAQQHMVVQIAGKPEVVDATFAALGVKPERP